MTSVGECLLKASVKCLLSRRVALSGHIYKQGRKVEGPCFLFLYENMRLEREGVSACYLHLASLHCQDSGGRVELVGWKIEDCDDA